MSMIQTRTLAPGERSLPAELRTARGYGFAQRRLANGMRGVSGWGGAGMRGLGQDDGEDLSGDLGGDLSTLPLDTSSPVLTDVSTLPDVQVQDLSTLPLNNPILVSPVTSGQAIPNVPGYSAPAGTPVTVANGTTPPTAPSGYQWVQAANGAALNLAKVLAISQGGTVLQLPNGQQVISGSSGGLATGALGTLTGFNLSGILPWLLLIGGGVFVLSLVEKR